MQLIVIDSLNIIEKYRKTCFFFRIFLSLILFGKKLEHIVLKILITIKMHYKVKHK